MLCIKLKMLKYVLSVVLPKHHEHGHKVSLKDIPNKNVYTG